ncbi:DUF1722 domain-containing protein, partial [Staphylococcus warneri]|uniref:DUF1722 domain-containing protein n=1 Tax=Staphylococcus warneri TaxID=1292 RepID=UPI0011A12379
PIIIQHPITIHPTQHTVINPYHHISPYFKNFPTHEQNQNSQTFKQQFLNHPLSIHHLISFLNLLANKYDIHYIQQTTLLKE